MIPRIADVPKVPEDVKTFCKLLSQQGFAGEIDLSFSTRLSLATDNSIYQLLPAGVIFPRSSQDVRQLCALLSDPRFRGISLSARGGGTGTNGQSLNSGLIVDFSRHMAQILSLDRESRRVRVQPGVVLDDLNRFLRAAGFFFAPTVSPSSRATIGGMIATDASGKGSRIFGKTSDHVAGLSVVFADGSAAEVGVVEQSKIADLLKLDSIIGRLAKRVYQTATEHAELIANVLPKVPRGVTGYNLQQALTTQGDLDLTRIITGSEGTLALVTEAELKVLELPPFKGIVVIGFDSFQRALESTQALLTLNPLAVEICDDKLLALARGDRELWNKLSAVLSTESGSVEGLVIVEFYDQTEQDLLANLQATEELARELNSVVAVTKVKDLSTQGSVWEFRKKAVGLLGRTQGVRRPVPFIEDTAVPPTQLAAYIAELRDVLERRNLSYAMFGHIDAGCLHVRPSLDLRQPADRALIRPISEEVQGLVAKYGGVFWGEHGKGFRSEFIPAVFGEILFKELREIKQAADPFNQLNPGKLVTPSSERVGVALLDQPPLRGELDAQITPSLQDRFENSLYCNGNGQCFSTDPKVVMCPSSKVTRDRVHSPKGRASLLREWSRAVSSTKDAAMQLEAKSSWPLRLLRKARFSLSKLFGSYDFSHEVAAGLAGCLSCKACATQCPVEVDIPSYKAKFLELYHSRYLRTPRHYAVRYLEKLAFLASHFPGLANLFIHNPAALFLSSKICGLQAPPKLSQPNIWAELRRLGVEELSSDFRQESAKGQSEALVAIVPDAFTYFFDVPVVTASIELLRTLGYQVTVLPFRENGKPAHVFGFLAAFRRIATRQAELLRACADQGASLISLEPSIALTYREEYQAELKGSAMTTSLPEVFMIAEFLAQELKREGSPAARFAKSRVGSMAAGELELFLHCTEQTAVVRSAQLWQDVGAALGVKLRVQQLGCCGMAGVYGHQTEHQKESKGIFQLSWKDPVMQCGSKGSEIAATGYSCRTQIRRFGEARAQSPSEWILCKLRIGSV